jgi:Mrp family chromosome partitioning ATPase
MSAEGIIALADLAQMTQLIAQVSGAKKGQSITNSDSSGVCRSIYSTKGGVGTTSVCQGIASSWANSGFVGGGS